MNTPRLETERLILRKFTEEDIEALYALLSDREANTFLPGVPLRSLAETRTFCEERFLRYYGRPGAYRYVIALRESGEAVGYLNVEPGESRDFGYGLRRELWHRGIVTEAGRAVIVRLREDGIPYITATHDVNNPRSGGVMRNLGMQYQYSYEEQWQPKDIPVTFRLYQMNLDGKARVYRKYWDESEIHFVESGLSAEAGAPNI